jgi:hypothetical protein
MFLNNNKYPLRSDPRHKNLQLEDTPADGGKATRGEDGGGLGTNMIPRRRLAIRVAIGVNITLLVALGVPRTDGNSFPILEHLQQRLYTSAL